MSVFTERCVCRDFSVKGVLIIPQHDPTKKQDTATNSFNVTPRHVAFKQQEYILAVCVQITGNYSCSCTQISKIYCCFCVQITTIYSCPLYAVSLCIELQVLPAVDFSVQGRAKDLSATLENMSRRCNTAMPVSVIQLQISIQAHRPVLRTGQGETPRPCVAAVQWTRAGAQVTDESVQSNDSSSRDDCQPVKTAVIA